MQIPCNDAVLSLDHCTNCSNWNVSGTKPDKEGKKGVKHDFKKAPDGRFIFTAGEEEEEKKEKGKKRPKADDGGLYQGFIVKCVTIH